MIYRILFCALVSFFISQPSVHAADALLAHSDDGLPFYSIYNLDYLGKGSVRVRLSEDKNGRLIAIDTGVIMVFDGNSWSSRVSRKGSASDSVISAKSAKDGFLYSGSVGSWGYLDVLPEGDFIYKAFPSDNAPEWTSAAHFDDVLTTDIGVFYRSTLGIVHHGYDGQSHYWGNLLPPQTLFDYKGSIYMSVGSGGLYVLKDWQWVLIEGTERFGGNEAITKMVECADGRTILGSSSGKLYVFDGKVLTVWHTDAESTLSQGLMDIIALPASEIAIAVRGYGVFVLDKNGHVTMRLGYDHDDIFSGVTELYQMENGILWAAIPGGVAKLYYPSQVTFYDYRFGIPMSWPEVYHYKDVIMVYSDYRIFLGSYDMTGCISKFEELKTPDGGLVESCLGVGDGMLFGVSGNLYFYNGTGIPIEVARGVSSARMRQVAGDQKYLVVFGSEKHVLLHEENGKWTVVQSIPSMGFPAVVLQSRGGDMWIEHGLGRVCRLSLVNGHLVSTDFDKIEGMSSQWANVWELKGQIYLSSGEVIKRFDSETNTLVNAPEMLDLTRMIGGKVSRFFEAPDGTIWASGVEGVFLVKMEDGKTFVDRETLRPVSESHPLIRFDGDNIVWMTSRNRIIRYNALRNPPKYRELKPVISMASVISTQSNEMTETKLTSGSEPPVSFPFETNNITLRLFPNTYSLPSPPSYRYRLGGSNGAWTTPLDEPIISFSNLTEGSYKLDVEVLYQDVPIGAISTYTFEIRPPWRRTWWAYVAYANLGLAFVLIIVRFSQRHSERERKRLERLVAMRTRELDDTNTRLRESIKSAMAAAEAKSRFLANMSHEIRTPMNGVVGTTELLARTPLTGEQRELVDIINKSGSLLLSIVNDVLDYSKIEADQLVFELIPLRPQVLLEDVLEILGEKANEKRVEFFGSVEAGVPFELIGDTTRVQQILVNLCSNALKFTDHGEVEMKCWAKERQDGRWDLFFSVRDTGIGMDPKRMNRLFKAFSQLDASNTRVYGGTGLGLAISKRLVERMGGAMEVTSEVGKGSCFELSIPLSVSERNSSADEPQAEGAKAIMLVDDCSARRELISRYLTRRGYTIFDMPSSEAVSALTQGRQFDIIVADCAIDSESWRDVADAITKTNKRVPMLVYRLPLQSVEHPAIVRRLTKPWRCNRLLAEIRDCLESGGEKASEATVIQGETDQNLATSNLKILLAEDNAVNQRVAVLLLSRLGVKPDLANNGEEAVDLVKAHAYDIVLMDVQMPVMDGIQATLAIRNSLRHDEQPIIVALTAGAMSSDREAAFSAGVDAYLTKPLRLETLREQLNDLVEKVKMRRIAANS